MRRLIYQYWDGKVSPAVRAGVREMRRYANHIFPVARWLVGVVSNVLVDALLQVVKDGVSGSFPDASGEVGGVRGIERAWTRLGK